jgi:RimJ/RimL family protein N-acetyltransferase
LTFRRIYDLGIVHRILTHPRIWPHVGDDFAGPPEGWAPPSDSRIWWVLAMDGGPILGLFTFLPRSTVLWEMHVAMLPTAWGPSAVRAGRLVIPWLFEHSTCRRLIGEVPDSNRLAMRYAESIGFRRFGTNRCAFMKNGALKDLVLFGISKED